MTGHKWSINCCRMTHSVAAVCAINRRLVTILVSCNLPPLTFQLRKLGLAAGSGHIYVYMQALYSDSRTTRNCIFFASSSFFCHMHSVTVGMWCHLKHLICNSGNIVSYAALIPSSRIRWVQLLSPIHHPELCGHHEIEEPLSIPADGNR